MLRGMQLTHTGKTLLAIGLLALVGVGCHDDAPHDYGQQRPDISQLSPDDRGLQSKDVQAATSQMIADLASSPQLNASPTQWTMVVTGVDDQTRDHMMPVNFDIFTESLRTAISQHAMGRIQLIENKDKFNSLRNKELEGNADPYKQGGGANAAPAAINPEYGLYAKAMDMPNRSTNFYSIQYVITNLRTRAQVWSGSYQVKVAR